MATMNSLVSMVQSSLQSNDPVTELPGQVALPKSVPSHSSAPSRTPLPQSGAPMVVLLLDDVDVDVVLELDVLLLELVLVTVVVLDVEDVLLDVEVVVAIEVDVLLDDEVLTEVEVLLEVDVVVAGPMSTQVHASVQKPHAPPTKAPPVEPLVSAPGLAIRQIHMGSAHTGAAGGISARFQLLRGLTGKE